MWGSRGASVCVCVCGCVCVLGGEWVGDGQGESCTAWPVGSVQPEKENNKRGKKKKLQNTRVLLSQLREK